MVLQEYEREDRHRILTAEEDIFMDHLIPYYWLLTTKLQRGPTPQSVLRSRRMSLEVCLCGRVLPTDWQRYPTPPRDADPLDSSSYSKQLHGADVGMGEFSACWPLGTPAHGEEPVCVDSYSPASPSTSCAQKAATDRYGASAIISGREPACAFKLANAVEEEGEARGSASHPANRANGHLLASPVAVATPLQHEVSGAAGSPEPRMPSLALHAHTQATFLPFSDVTRGQRSHLEVDEPPPPSARTEAPLASSTNVAIETQSQVRFPSELLRDENIRSAPTVCCADGTHQAANLTAPTTCQISSASSALTSSECFEPCVSPYSVASDTLQACALRASPLGSKQLCRASVAVALGVESDPQMPDEEDGRAYSMEGETADPSGGGRAGLRPAAAEIHQDSGWASTPWASGNLVAASRSGAVKACGQAWAAAEPERQSAEVEAVTGGATVLRSFRGNSGERVAVVSYEGETCSPSRLPSLPHRRIALATGTRSATAAPLELYSFKASVFGGQGATAANGAVNRTLSAKVDNTLASQKARLPTTSSAVSEAASAPPTAPLGHTALLSTSLSTPLQLPRASPTFPRTPVSGTLSPSAQLWVGSFSSLQADECVQRAVLCALEYYEWSSRLFPLSDIVRERERLDVSFVGGSIAAAVESEVVLLEANERGCVLTCRVPVSVGCGTPPALSNA
ncbi:hypothetical protein ABL78_3679 [Leptomonas seymouri]|uniref:Uncharacterized protein n=1 Tax=Leptomonas seymouri TaxID=5684 RepID=A0A0N1IL69_LEPSE|nr:hypothetical protein ABL78_3679 [Leptomonas seymouri]|eukprot:KPI87242.1 hypothetical protein ABL78_3679 [Leptomonas seymouri]